MAKRTTLAISLAALALIILFYVLWNGPSPNQPPPKQRPLQRLAKQAQPSAQPAPPDAEAVPPNMLPKPPLRPPDPKPNFIKSTDIPEDNGMHWFLLAAELMPDFLLDQNLLDQMFESGWLDPATSDQIAKCRDAFNAIRKGLQVGNANLPLEPEKSVPGLQGQWRNLTQLMTLDAMSKAGRGNIDEAIETFATLIDFASESTRGGFLIYQLTSIPMRRTVAMQFCKTLQMPAVSADQCRAALNQLIALEAKASTVADGMAIEAAATEYWYKKETPDTIRDTMRSAAKNLDEEEIHFVEDASTDDLLQYYRQAIEVRKQLVPLFSVEVYEFDKAAYQKLVQSNWLCQGAADQRVLKSQAFNRANIRGTILVAAIEAYKRDEGSYPPNLDALATDLPKDPFTGRPFGYSKQGAGYTLYSVGNNMTDENGKGNPWDPKQDDYVIVRRN